MGDETQRPDGEEPSRRFRIVRKVKAPGPAPSEAAPADEPDETLRGTTGMNYEVGQGCTGCIRVTGLIVVIMLASIIGTCAFIRP